MEVIKTDIEGVLIIEPKVFKDARGYFFESFSQREFEQKVCPIHFVQDNESMSSYGVMRGLHFQRPPFTQSKLLRCVKGAQRLCSWLCRAERDRSLPVQVRRVLPSRGRRRHLHPGRESRHRLAHPERESAPERERHPASMPQGFRQPIHIPKFIIHSS